MGWKRIPVGPFDLSGDTDPTLSKDLNTNGYGVKLSDVLPNQGYSGIIVNGQINNASVGQLVAFDTSIGNGEYVPCDISSGSTTNPVVGMLVELNGSDGKILVNGLFKNNGLNLPAKGSVLYAGLAGNISDTPPSTENSGQTVQAIGYSWDDQESNSIIYIKPSRVVMRIS